MLELTRIRVKVHAIWCRATDPNARAALAHAPAHISQLSHANDRCTLTWSLSRVCYIARNNRAHEKLADDRYSGRTPGSVHKTGPHSTTILTPLKHSRAKAAFCCPKDQQDRPDKSLRLQYQVSAFTCQHPRCSSLTVGNWRASLSCFCTQTFSGLSASFSCSPWRKRGDDEARGWLAGGSRRSADLARRRRIYVLRGQDVLAGD